jgi:ADP-ribose pyrophosphatase YjhB (NUDIX family)
VAIAMGLLHGWRFCPRCAAELDVGRGRADCRACGSAYYASSAPTAGALVLDGDGRILLARRGIEPYRGFWDIPGGFLDEGEHPLDAVRRELREEAGVEIEPLSFFGAWVDSYGESDDTHSTLNLYWKARIVAGVPRPADDVAELAWFSPGELPPDDEIAFRRLPSVLHAWRDEHP